MKLLLLIGLIFICRSSMAQLSAADDSLIASAGFYHPGDFSYYGLPGNSQQLMKGQNKSFIANYNPFSLLLKGSMWAYQNILSAQLSAPCPYEISCSNFAKASIREFGAIKGVAIAADRLMRCNRISLMDVSPLDIDPVNHHIIDKPGKYRWHPH